MTTKVRVGLERYEWGLSLVDGKGFFLGIHFGKGRKASRAQMAILKTALTDAAKKIDELSAKKPNANVTGLAPEGD